MSIQSIAQTLVAIAVTALLIWWFYRLDLTAHDKDGEAASKGRKDS